MPPTTPIEGFPKMAVVMARLIVEGEDRGIHPFIVETSDSQGMCPNITSARLPPRSGSTPLDFAITTFNRVHLPSTAFLGVSLDKPDNVQLLLHSYLWRIGLGTGILPIHGINGLAFIATIGADYSYRRHVQGKGPEKVPIISFRTQQLPLLHSIAAAHVFKAWQPAVIKVLMSDEMDPRSRHGMGVVFKATVSRMITTIAREVGERIGAQGLFGHNFISQLEVSNDVRGMAIAEGDILVLSIRLFSELLLGRYTVPQPDHHEQSLLSRHSAGVFSKASEVLGSLPKGHKDPAFNNLLLPQSETAVMALGNALAYSAALHAGVPRPLVDIFELLVIRQDEGWYIENAELTQAKRMQMEDAAVRAALPHVKGSSWYLIASVAFSASNRPEAVPVVFHTALAELQREQLEAGEESTAAHEAQLKLARRSRDCLFQAGLLCGYSRSINGLLALHETMPSHLRDSETLRNTEKSIQDYAKDGSTLYKKMYGDNADNVQNLLNRWFSNTIGYGVVYGGADVLTQSESSFVIATANIAMGTPRQIAWHLKNAMNGGATLDEVQAVRKIAIEVASKAGVTWHEDIPEVAQT
ncbi:hypothetical protein EUX98_g1989 [Antrodiella citrinella]|uniref:Carboxymuconolactone decarboxylase-like domain-containing protein n=1 Tax=Antrodiella citrinella TaxID=2447956 RepID=A0A4S4N037_9APHY|nr:hypothetical protein EUX98_g1989 [Antrodiella citrinella]